MRRVLAMTFLAVAAVLALAGRAHAADPLDTMLAPWVDRQTADGAFPDWPGTRTGGAGGYAESMLGLALATRGVQTGDARMTLAGERGLRWAVDHPASTIAGRQSVFEDLALATAYDTLRDRLEPDLVDALRARVFKTVLARRVDSRYSNHGLTETLRILTANHAGISLPPIDSLNAAGMLSGAVPRYGHAYGQRRRGVRAAVFSDPAANPIAYQALTLAFLARSTLLLGPSATPQLKATVVAMAEGSAQLMAPDGDVAYWGRSQEESWALPFTAYGAQVAARLRPAVAPRMRRLAQRALARFDALHVTPDGLALSPAMARAAPGEDLRRGLDGYASLPAYVGLTAVALEWVDRGFATTAPIAPGLPADADGATVLSGRSSRFAVVRSTDRWWAVKLRPATRLGDDGRADFGLIAFKRRGLDGAWTDVLPLRPFDAAAACPRGACRTPPPSLGPVAVTRAGAATPIGDDLRLGHGARRRWVTITGRFVKPDGTTSAPLRAVFRPDAAGVRMTWDVRAGATYRLSGLFDERRGPVCLRGTTIGNQGGSLRLPPVTQLTTTPGLASGSHRAITAATATVRATARGRLSAVWSERPVNCP